MKGKDLARSVINKIQEPSLTVPAVVDEIDNQLYMLTERLLLPHLISSATVTTDTSSDNIALPDNYHRELFDARYGDNYTSIDVLNSYQDLLEEFKGKELYSGKLVACVAVDASSRLYYRRVPSEATEIHIKYYRKHTEITQFNEIEAGIAYKRLLERYLFHATVAHIWDELEDGVDGNKVNTDHHTRKKEEYFYLLDTKCIKNTSRRRPPQVRYSL